ncbi:serine/threonine protein phosphatase [Xaviernesmea oryzae]|uniref:Serine/threonine protein phosphatase n=1 Tax=Xaviernesmea oryzae TaxID=464029 RepID=A0A1Q9ASY7_9HYPH|nr:DNA repair exonuclease [Xaviernesmea oryzae]OLP58498.1 serine/threonine protein phosphatase [Xaviernesmea oryzae]SEK59333.1 DNA repair exonuclease SbcCD nuclease subunit [Xaviernesmea oryzae]
MPFRFVHTADLHLDSPLSSLALKNADLSDLVRGATRAALSAIVDLCLAEDVDALLIVGDLYDGAQTSMNTALFLSAELRRLDAQGIRVFVIRGNHDSASTIKRELTFPDNVHLFSGKQRAVQAATLANGRPVYVHGVGFDNPHAPESLLPGFQPPFADAINIGMLHTSLAGAPGHDAYAPCSLSELIGHGFDYWALGHVHLRQVHCEKPLIVMPGMPQGRDINEAGGKSVTLVTVGEDGTLTHEERRIGTAAFERISIDLTGVESWSGALQAIGRALDAGRHLHAEGQVIARLMLSGATPLAARLRRDPDFLLGEAVNLAASRNGLWIETVEVACTGAGGSNSVGADPVEELGRLMREDVLTAPGFRREVEVLFEDFLGQLPRELRERFVAEEAAAADLTAMLAIQGAEDVLAALSGSGVGEPT